MSDRRTQRPGVTHRDLPPQIFRDQNGLVLSDDCPPEQRGGGRRGPIVRAEAEVRKLQEALGIPTKERDGMLGPRTAEALRNSRNPDGQFPPAVEQARRDLLERLERDNPGRGLSIRNGLEAQRPTSRHCATSDVLLEGANTPINTPIVSAEFERVTKTPPHRDAARAPDGTIRIVPDLGAQLEGSGTPGLPRQLQRQDGITIQIPEGCRVPETGTLQNIPGTTSGPTTGGIQLLPAIVGNDRPGGFQNLPYVVECGRLREGNGTPFVEPDRTPKEQDLGRDHLNYGNFNFG